MPRKPKITTNCVASRFEGPRERIIEFSSEGGGGLIAFRVLDRASGPPILRVEVYRQDVTVVVVQGEPEKRTQRQGVSDG